MKKLEQALAILPIFDYEWIRKLTFVPSHVELKEVRSFYQHSKGRLVQIIIKDTPANFSKLKDWLDYRASINKPVVVYLTKAEDRFMLKLRAEDLEDYIYIELATKRVYVAKDTVIRGQFASFLRYLLYYAGYSLSYKTAGKAKSFKPAKTKQIGLEVIAHG